MTDAELMEALTDLDALALTIFGEARGEPLEGKAAVASVVMNRLTMPTRYGATVKEICLQARQFSVWIPGLNANHAKMMSMGERLRSGMLGADPDGQSLAECQFIATGYLKGILQSRVGNCDHYITSELFTSSSRPDWVKPPFTLIGSQVFMKVA